MGRQETEHRESSVLLSWRYGTKRDRRDGERLLIACWENRGYVALAVATEQGTFTREVETGLGGDREGNMVAFAAEALKLLKDVMKGDAKL